MGGRPQQEVTGREAQRRLGRRGWLILREIGWDDSIYSMSLLKKYIIICFSLSILRFVVLNVTSILFFIINSILYFITTEVAINI